MAWNVYHYFDVVGNKEEGWFVGGESLGKHSLLLPENATVEDILKQLEQIGFRADIIYLKQNKSTIELYLKENDMPIGRLERKN